MFGVTVMRPQSGAQFRLVNEFVRRRHVLEGILRSQKRPIDIRRIGLAQPPQSAFVGAPARWPPVAASLSFFLVCGRDLVGGEVESFRELADSICCRSDAGSNPGFRRSRWPTSQTARSSAASSFRWARNGWCERPGRGPVPPAKLLPAAGRIATEWRWHRRARGRGRGRVDQLFKFGGDGLPHRFHARACLIMRGAGRASSPRINSPRRRASGNGCDSRNWHKIDPAARGHDQHHIGRGATGRKYRARSKA
jgi:hypothetical protein